MEKSTIKTITDNEYKKKLILKKYSMRSTKIYSVVLKVPIKQNT